MASIKKKPPSSEEEQEFEILKAVAQAWHGHSGHSRPMHEFQSYRNSFRTKPSRFKLEAMNKMSKEVDTHSSWDFGQSLWDSYELVTLTKKLEAGMILNHPLDGSGDSSIRVKKRKESSHSLRRLFNAISSSSSKRLDYRVPLPPEDGERF